MLSKAKNNFGEVLKYLRLPRPKPFPSRQGVPFAGLLLLLLSALVLECVALLVLPGLQGSLLLLRKWSRGGARMLRLRGFSVLHPSLSLPNASLGREPCLPKIVQAFFFLSPPEALRVPSFRFWH